MFSYKSLTLYGVFHDLEESKANEKKQKMSTYVIRTSELNETLKWEKKKELSMMKDWIFCFGF